MKRIITIIILIIITSCAAYSQIKITGDYILPKGKPFDVAKAATSPGLTNPELVFVGTFNQTLTTKDYIINIKYDLSNGKATGWVYIFREKNDSSKLSAIGVVSIPIVGPLAQSIPIDQLLGNSLPIDVSHPLDSYDWINSDEAATQFRTNTDLTTLYASKDTIDILALALFYNSTFYTYIEKDKPYWGITLRKGATTVSCAVNALTKEIVCQAFTPVAEDNTSSDNLEVYPNPASNNINISIPYDFLAKGGSLEIFDSYGRKIANWDDIISGNNNFNINGLATGVYFVKYFANGVFKTTQFVVKN